MRSWLEYSPQCARTKKQLDSQLNANLRSWICLDRCFCAGRIHHGRPAPVVVFTFFATLYGPKRLSEAPCGKHHNSQVHQAFDISFENVFVQISDTSNLP